MSDVDGESLIMEAGSKVRYGWSFGTKIIQRLVVGMGCHSLAGR